jgi:NAD(P)-dependent dehydrogenase (short-subunit alcohol dehydrogenase family)
MQSDPKQLFSLSEKRAVVTGGAGGIGFACAQALGLYGASVLLVDRDGSTLANAKHQLEAQQVLVDTFCCDVSDSNRVNDLATTISKSGGVDVFFHSAAITIRKKVLDMSEDEWRSIIRVNLDGAFLVGRAIASAMVRQDRGGSMVFIVSTGAYRAGVNFGAYSASKAGVVMLANTLALELAPHRIRVNTLAPTATDTNFTVDYYRQNPEALRSTIANHPLGRIASPQDYQGTAVYLASEASAFVTGTMITVDGGKTAK